MDGGIIDFLFSYSYISLFSIFSKKIMFSFYNIFLKSYK